MTVENLGQSSRWSHCPQQSRSQQEKRGEVRHLDQLLHDQFSKEVRVHLWMDLCHRRLRHRRCQGRDLGHLRSRPRRVRTSEWLALHAITEVNGAMGFVTRWLVERERLTQECLARLISDFHARKVPRWRLQYQLRHRLQRFRIRRRCRGEDFSRRPDPQKTWDWSSQFLHDSG